MNKKILVACLCVTLMLITPLVVAKENKITTNIMEESIVVEPNVDDIEGLVAQLRVVINEILQDYGHISMIRNQCNKIVDVLDSFGLIVYCIFLCVLFLPLFIIVLFMNFLGLWGTYIFNNILWLTLGIAMTIDLDCLSSGSNLSLNSMSNLINECPCMQQ